MKRKQQPMYQSKMKLNKTTEKVIISLLKAKGNKMDIWELSRKCGYLLDVIKSAELLKKVGAVKLENSTVTLTNKIKFPEYLVKNERPLNEVMRKYTAYRKRAVFSNDDYDQLSILPGAVYNKLAVMLKKNDLRNRDVLCMGDDDLFSVACSLTALPKSITIFEVDEKVIGFINKISRELPIPIKTVSLNLLKPLPKSYSGSFDVFIAEPPDTVKGTLLFVSRGIQALRKDGVFYLGMTEVTLNKKQWLEIEKTVLATGIALTDIIGDFEEYVIEGNELIWKGFEKLPKWVNKPAKRPWFVSTLFRGEVAGVKKPIKFSFKDVKKELITSLLP